MMRRTFFIAACLGVLICATPFQPGLAAPITFNTALPVPMGQAIIRVQFKTIRSAEDPSPADRQLDVDVFPVVGVYGVTEKLALFAIVPIFDKSMSALTPSGRRTRSVSGLGDATVLARYTVFQRDRPGRTTRVAPFLGVEAPTGDDSETDDFGRLPQPFQLGSGSWDFTIGMVATWQTWNRQVDVSLGNSWNQAANGFEFGDEIRLDLSYQHRLWPGELGGGVPKVLYGVVESNLVRQDRHRASGVADPDSGGTTWFLASGIQYVSKRLVIEAAVQIPVIQDLEGSALENDFITTLSARMNF